MQNANSRRVTFAFEVSDDVYVTAGQDTVGTGSQPTAPTAGETGEANSSPHDEGVEGHFSPASYMALLHLWDSD